MVADIESVKRMEVYAVKATRSEVLVQDESESNQNLDSDGRKSGIRLIGETARRKREINSSHWDQHAVT